MLWKGLLSQDKHLQTSLTVLSYMVIVALKSMGHTAKVCRSDMTDFS